MPTSEQQTKPWPTLVGSHVPVPWPRRHTASYRDLGLPRRSTPPIGQWPRQWRASCPGTQRAPAARGTVTPVHRCLRGVPSRRPRVRQPPRDPTWRSCAATPRGHQPPGLPARLSNPVTWWRQPVVEPTPTCCRGRGCARAPLHRVRAHGTSHSRRSSRALEGRPRPKLLTITGASNVTGCCRRSKRSAPRRTPRGSRSRSMPPACPAPGHSRRRPITWPSAATSSTPPTVPARSSAPRSTFETGSRSSPWWRGRPRVDLDEVIWTSRRTGRRPVPERGRRIRHGERTRRARRIAGTRSATTKRTLAAQAPARPRGQSRG